MAQSNNCSMSESCVWILKLQTKVTIKVTFQSLSIKRAGTLNFGPFFQRDARMQVKALDVGK